MVLGLTGPYCSGKSRIGTYLVNQGFIEIDVDRLGHQALEACREEVVEAFGPGVLRPEGGIDRKALGAVVFSDSRQLTLLEGIVHPRMRMMVEERLKTLNGPVIINAALLFKMGLHVHCQGVIMVHAPLWQRLWRGRKRDGLSWRQVLKRIVTQAGLFSQASLPETDIYRVDNGGSFETTREQLDSLLRIKGLV